MARKMSGFSPFLTPCAQGGGPWGPWGGFFQVPPGAHQITPKAIGEAHINGFIAKNKIA